MDLVITYNGIYYIVYALKCCYLIDFFMGLKLQLLPGNLKLLHSSLFESTGDLLRDLFDSNIFTFICALLKSKSNIKIFYKKKKTHFHGIFMLHYSYFLFQFSFLKCRHEKFYYSSILLSKQKKKKLYTPYSYFIHIECE